MPGRFDRKLAQRLGRRIRALREEAGITQEQLAWTIDLSKSFLSQIESGQRLPSIPVLFAIAHELDLEAADLLVFDLRHPRLLLLDGARRHDAKAVKRALAKVGLG